MYLSVLAPVPGREEEAAAEWAGGPAAEHEWLAKFFHEPNSTQCATHDFLFRRSTNGVTRFHVLSNRIPRTQSGAWSVETRPYAPRFPAGARAQFALRANPMITESRGGKSQCHDAVPREKQRLLREHGAPTWSSWQDPGKPAIDSLVEKSCGEWLQARAARHGFEVRPESLSVCDFQQHAGDGLTNSNPARTCGVGGELSTVDFSGELTVVDPVTFGFALQNGIGRAKAFGCGLLLVTPSQT
jgi:CRISPR system Cascade subunit CasE